MTTFTTNPSLVLPEPGVRLTLAWTCTRRARPAADASTLDRARLVVIVEPFDRQHAMVEAFVEVDGSRARTLVHRTARPCATSVAGGLAHLDIADPDDGRLLALTVAQIDGSLAYAQTSLLTRAGFAPGACDRPSLQRVGEQHMAQSA